MATDAAVSGYSHTQTSPLIWVLTGVGLAWLGFAWAIGFPFVEYIALGVLAVLGFLWLTFRELAVADAGDRLAIRFGPIPLFHRTVHYADIDSVGSGRTLLLDGWGVHYSVRGGWVWNIWGRDCVVIHMKRGTLWLGTDDAQNLVRFLSEKIAASGPSLA